jgi:hypothetical protein
MNRFSKKKSKKDNPKLWKKIVKKIKSSSKGAKKGQWSARKSNRTKTITFGSKGASDYTKHKDKERKQRYIDRHKKREDWNDLMTAGALSKHILWNKPSFKKSKKDYKKMLKKQGYLN